jgi:hypothetical protein
VNEWEGMRCVVLEGKGKGGCCCVVRCGKGVLGGKYNCYDTITLLNTSTWSGLYELCSKVDRLTITQANASKSSSSPPAHHRLRPFSLIARQGLHAAGPSQRELQACVKTGNDADMKATVIHALREE